jgi:hypothetical protein
MNRSARQIGEKILVLFYQPGQRIKILMVAVDAIEWPAEALSLFNKKVMQVGPVDSKVPEMNHAGDVTSQRVYSVFYLLVDRIKVAMGITDDQYHYAPPS